MKLYTGENIKKVIEANKGKWTTAETSNYIIIYPTPALYLRPINAKAIVFFKRLTTAPAKYPGGVYSAKQYTVTPEKNTLPKKYKDILTAAIIEQQEAKTC